MDNLANYKKRIITVQACTCSEHISLDYKKEMCSFMLVFASNDLACESSYFNFRVLFRRVNQVKRRKVGNIGRSRWLGLS